MILYWDNLPRFVHSQCFGIRLEISPYVYLNPVLCFVRIETHFNFFFSSKFYYIETSDCEKTSPRKYLRATKTVTPNMRSSKRLILVFSQTDVPPLHEVVNFVTAYSIKIKNLRKEKCEFCTFFQAHFLKRLKELINLYGWTQPDQNTYIYL
jgi:hypothetical protein